MTCKLFLCVLIALLFGAPAPTPAIERASDLRWFHDYVGKSSSDLVSDRRFKAAVRALLPTQAPLPRTNDTADAAIDYMAQGQGGIEGMGSSIMAHGCLPHACNIAGGWFWIDTGSPHPKVMLALLQPHGGAPSASLPFTLILIGNDPRPDQTLPEFARRSLTAWLKTMRATNIADFELLSKAGKHKTKAPSYLQVD